MSRFAFVLALAILVAPRTTSPIAPGVYFVPGVFVPGSQPDGNSVIFEARDGLVVVDTGRHPEHVRDIEDVARRLKRPLKAVVNTHWHLDHTGGNILLRDHFPGLRVVASGAMHEARSGFLASYRQQLEDVIVKTADAAARDGFKAEARLIDNGALLEPDEVVTKSGKRTIAGLPLEFGLETYAVTAGDLWLFDSRTKLLVAGDLVTLPAPLLDTACPARWKDSLDRLARVDFRLLVPGHGEPMARDMFNAYRTAFEHLLVCAASAKSKDDCISGWLTDAAPLLAGSDRAFTTSLMDYYVGVLRQDPAKTRKLCGG